MKHVISPLDLSTQELSDILSLAGKILDDPKNILDAATVKNLPLFFMNQVPEPA